MGQFERCFSEPIRDDYGDTGFALDGSYSREEAIELFTEVSEEYDEHFDPNNMGRGYARFYGGWDDYGEFVNAWWWELWKTGKRGEKELWLSYAPDTAPQDTEAGDE